MRSSALPPRTTNTVPAASCRSTRASRACSTWRRSALACRSAGVAYPRTRPSFPPAGMASRARIRRIRACRLAFCPRRFCPASRTWSSLVRVIAPAHRDDDSAVSARFRAARDTAWPLASSRPRRTARPGHGPPATPDGCPPPAARPHLGRTPGAGCGPAPPPGQPPRTGRRSAAARSPATTAYDTACPPSQDHMTSLARTNRFYYLRHAEHGNSSHPSRRASKSGDLLSAASSPDLRHVFSMANRCRPMLTSTSRTMQDPPPGIPWQAPVTGNGRIRR